MAWIRTREQVFVGFLFVMLLAIATAGRLGAAEDPMGWLANPPMGNVSVADTATLEGPVQPAADQVRAALQKRLRGFELAAIQSELERTGLQQQVLNLKVQVNEGAARLQSSAQALESTHAQLKSEQAMRENLSRELAETQQWAESLSQQLLEAQAQITRLQNQLTPATPVQPAPAQALPAGSAGQP